MIFGVWQLCENVKENSRGVNIVTRVIFLTDAIVIIGMVSMDKYFLLIFGLQQLCENVKGNFERSKYCRLGDFGDCCNWDGYYE